MQASFIGALFVLLTVPVTFYEVAMHLEYFSRPSLQIHVIRILWMVPIYAIDAWAALRFPVCTGARFTCVSRLAFPVSWYARTGPVNSPTCRLRSLLAVCTQSLA